jgi:hypothetical protein
VSSPTGLAEEPVQSLLPLNAIGLAQHPLGLAVPDELAGGGDGRSLTGLLAEAQELEQGGAVLALGGLRQISLLEHLKPVGKPDGSRGSGAGLGIHNAWRKDKVTLSFV